MKSYTISHPKTKNRKQTNNSPVLIIAILLVIVFIIVFIVKNNNDSSISSYENRMVSQAKQYVKDHNINTTKEMYLDVSKLDVALPNTCSLLSGVIYDGDNYQPYLLCNDYETEILENKADFSLIGRDIVFLLKGMEYYELGYSGNGKVSISSDKISDVGVYNIHYISETSNYILTRKVIVIDNPNLVNYFPVISLNGEDPIVVEKGNSYNESPSAFDIVDGDLTSNIIKVGNVNTGASGEYSVLYSVSNSLGYTKTIMRKVLVVDSVSNDLSVTVSLSNSNITNEDIKAIVSVKGNGYHHTKLPDNREISEMEFEYIITENGEYKFTIISKDGKEITKVLSVTNIDKTIPTGTCTATLYNDKTSINVNITSFNYIVGYNYYINNKASGFVTYNSYNSSISGAKNVYVIAKDYIGNEGKITCTITDKQSHFDPNGIRTVISGKPRLRIPIANALAKKNYSVNDLNKCIYNRVKEAGPYTRYGVAAAAFALIDCTYSMTGYVLSYNHTSGKVNVDPDANYCKYNSDICGKLGINTRWGSPGGQCGSGKTECWHGLNCATFVRWAMCNGGMDLCSKGSAASHGMTSKEYFKEADGVYINGKSVTYYSGKDLTNNSADTLVRMIKPGDAIASSEGGGHTFVVVGRDSNGIYTAEDGYYMRNIKYSTLTNGQIQYRILFLDNYYANPKNRNNLYN